MSSYEPYFVKINKNLNLLEREIDRISALDKGKREEIEKLYVKIYKDKRNIKQLFDNDLRFIKDECIKENGDGNTQKCEDIRLRFLSLIKRVKDMYTYLYKDVGKNILSFIGDTDEDVNIDKIDSFLEETMDPLDKGGKDALSKEFLCKVPKYVDGDMFLHNYKNKYDGINIDETFKSFFSDPEIECINNIFYFVGNRKELIIRAILKDRDENEFKRYVNDNWERFYQSNAGNIENLENISRLIGIIYDKGDISFLKTLSLRIRRLITDNRIQYILNRDENALDNVVIDLEELIEVENGRIPLRMKIHTIENAIAIYQFIRYNKKLTQFIKLINDITYLRIETNCNLKTIFKYNINPIKVLIVDIEGRPDSERDKKEKEFIEKGLKSIANRKYIRYDDNTSYTQLFKRVSNYLIDPATGDYHHRVSLDDREFFNAIKKYLLGVRGDSYVLLQIDYLIIKDITSKFLYYINEREVNIKKGIFSLNSEDYYTKDNLNYFSFTFQDTKRINYRMLLEYCNENQDVGDIKKMLEKKCRLKIYSKEIPRRTLYKNSEVSEFKERKEESDSDSDSDTDSDSKEVNFEEEILKRKKIFEVNNFKISFPHFVRGIHYLIRLQEKIDNINGRYSKKDVLDWHDKNSLDSLDIKEPLIFSKKDTLKYIFNNLLNQGISNNQINELIRETNNSFLVLLQNIYKDYFMPSYELEEYDTREDEYDFGIRFSD